MKNKGNIKIAAGVKKFWEQYSTICILVLVVSIFTIRDQNFLNIANLNKIFNQNVPLLIIVMGLSIIMIGGGIDLSIGYQISLNSVVISMLSVNKVPDGIVIAAALGTGLLCGLMNGILVAYFDIVPFAATIATQIIYLGLSYLISGGRMVANIPKTIRMLVKAEWLGIKIEVWIAVGCFIIVYILFRLLFWGKYIRAINLDEKNAERSGINVRRVKCMTYGLAGVFYALAAMIITATKGYAGSENGVGLEIAAITAAYIGGILGQAENLRLWMLVLGVLIIGIIENGLPIIGIASYAQYVITGIILIVAMILHRKNK